jgi:hypothetical protein
MGFFDSKNTALTKEKLLLNSTIEHLTAQMNELKQENNNLRSEIIRQKYALENNSNVSGSYKSSALTAENLSLKSNIELLTSQMKDLTQENKRLFSENNELLSTLNYKKIKSGEYEQKDKDYEKFCNDYYIRNLNEFYNKKKNIFSSCEQQMLYCLKKLFPADNIKRRMYVVFPYTRIADFVNGECKQEFKQYKGYIISNITKLHVDFLISLYVSNGKNSSYVPSLAIEVHGEEHYSNDYENQQTQKYDNIKTEIFKAIGLPFIVYKNEEILNQPLKDFIPKLEAKLFSVIERA